MKPPVSLPPGAMEISCEIPAWPHPGFGRDGRRIFGFQCDDDGVMPVFYRQRLREGITLHRIVAARATNGDRP
ncbi:hypothetical protein [Opitutus terrae]|nr:hypothetical protein [Opitutus terrae]